MMSYHSLEFRKHNWCAAVFNVCGKTMAENQTPPAAAAAAVAADGVIKKTSYIDEDKNTVLHYAAAHGDIEVIMEHIENGHEIDSANYLGWTPLLMATRNGHLEVVKLLIEKSANSTNKNNFGFNLLFMAIASGNISLLYFVVQHLLCGGISKQSLQNIFSPISFAVLHGNMQMVQYLVEKGFCVNANTPDAGISSVMFAEAMNNSEMVDFLLEKGAKETNRITSMPPRTSTKNHNLPPLIIRPIPQFPRKSSGILSAHFTPCISPIPPTPYVQHQVFFPPSFSPTQFCSPLPIPMYCGTPNDFLNTRIVQYPYYSPVFDNFQN